MARAREVQHARVGARAELHANAHMTARDLREHCAVNEGGDALLRTAVHAAGPQCPRLSRCAEGRPHHADLDDAGDISTAHVSEAI